MALSITALIISVGMDTSVELNNGNRINNIGLMQQQQNYIIISIAFIFLGFGVILTTRNSSSVKCEFCDEYIKINAKICKHCGKNVEKQNTRKKQEREKLKTGNPPKEAKENLLNPDDINRFTFRQSAKVAILSILGLLTIFSVWWLGTFFLVWAWAYSSDVNQIIAERVERKKLLNVLTALLQKEKESPT